MQTVSVRDVRRRIINKRLVRVRRHCSISIAKAKAAPKRRCESSSSSVAAPPGKAYGVIAKIIQHHRCPITHQLLVDPVVAEDGHVYERSALEHWLRTSEKSPVTNRPMGAIIMPAVAIRQTVNELVEGGMLDTDTLLQFFLTRGQMRAARTSMQGPDLEGAKADFIRARELAQHADMRQAVEFQLSAIAWMQQGVQLFTSARIQGEDVRTWMTEIGTAAKAAVMAPLVQRMTRWQVLPEDTRVKVVDDADELEKLCERPPPGAQAKVSWNPEMATFAGQVCVVKEMGEASHLNYILQREVAPTGRPYSFPYDALSLLG